MDGKDPKGNMITAVDSSQVEGSLIKGGKTRPTDCKKHHQKHEKKYVASEINKENVEFYLHKFSAPYKSHCFQDWQAKVVNFPESHAPELYAKFCDVAFRCATNYLGTTKTMEAKKIVPKRVNLKIWLQ